MSQTARQTLIGLVDREPAIGEDAKRCEAMLRDLCRNEHRKEIAALIAAIRERIVADLRAGTSGAPTAAFLGRLAGRLHDECGLRPCD